ncbi:PoNe immunity protein domain-containing protein, partial [Neisseria sicca]|uniref:PoNe immunity protein domain-containing protein n=1 Tax=Neisseria sicca TaxID=490 RepID=UPI0011AE2B36
MCEFEKKKRAIYLQEKFYIENKNFAETKIQEDVLSIQPPQWILDDPFQGARRYHRKLSWTQITEAMEYTQLLYSAGLPMPEVVSATHDMLERFHKHFDIDFPEDKLQLWEADSYAYILWLL